MHLQSLCGLLNVPPLLHMNMKFCGGGHRWLQSFILLLHRSLLSVEMTSPANAPCPAIASKQSSTAALCALIIFSSDNGTPATQQLVKPIHQKLARWVTPLASSHMHTTEAV
jgi:hypothetical protein